jgi:hypothetical protein
MLKSLVIAGLIQLT